jgi:hypothetical protein
MTNIFTLENFSDFSEKINIDELYEKKRLQDINKLELYRKILNRIHTRIKTTAKINSEKYCWFVVPEYIIGIPRYDQGACIAYVLDTLQTNGFKTRYFHPNTLLISWEHWVPTYVRNEIKKKTGIVVNEYGEYIQNENETDLSDEDNINDNKVQPINTKNNDSKKFTPINSYKPSGKLVYSDDLLHKMGNKLS